MFLFISDVKNAPSAPWATRADARGRSFAQAVPVATGANVGGGGPVVAQKKAVAG